ncbi:outer membrane lipoprotein carrier protein LolA [Vibrio hannami]|uniref:outer membrane lipoprotein carrier protein LolA n=1 Tax=Vibrio hannami TaxID=2717094 RepID=UPI00240F0C70|nr:outer membrane lipoprotein carrier protein LolA [Vibrio hannami]MDG3087537.1 outer membrane lipoprotein carrier protein LolA [Vibrio hannami]
MANLKTNVIAGVWFFLALIVSPNLFAKSMEEVQQHLSSHPVVRGDFEQVRELEMFKKPLVSTGEFTVAKEYGLLWGQKQPFVISLVLTEDKLSQKFGEQDAQVMTSDENPMAFYFSHLFLGLFQGDTEQLKSQFKLIFNSENESWKMELVPLKAPIDKVFTSIEISGSDYINSIKLNEVRGDVTTINFSNQNHVPDELSDNEKLAFQL